VQGVGFEPTASRPNLAVSASWRYQCYSFFAEIFPLFSFWKGTVLSSTKKLIGVDTSEGRRKQENQSLLREPPSMAPDAYAATDKVPVLRKHKALESRLSRNGLRRNCTALLVQELFLPFFAMVKAFQKFSLSFFLSVYNLKSRRQGFEDFQ
jgi:hypothetical protein